MHDPATDPWLVCDTCGRRFSLRGGALDERPDGDGGVQIAMRCPHCDATYPIARLTRRGVALREALNQRDLLSDEQWADALERYQREVTGLASWVKP